MGKTYKQDNKFVAFYLNVPWLWCILIASGASRTDGEMPMNKTSVQIKTYKE